MTAFRRTLTTPADLADSGLVTPVRADAIKEVAQRYAVAITPAMAQLIAPENDDDPIARQFIPDPRELQHTPSEDPDPIGDGIKSPVAGIVHRYPDRVLLKLVHVCPVYCRFCFRREMVGPGKSTALSDTELAAALDYVRANPQVWEVILTGGDPLILSPRRIAEVTAALGAIPHVKILRWHSRVPAVAPERITPQLVEALTSSGKTIYVALHANHPRELGDAARAASECLIDGGVAMVSQTVLLKGVNDDVDTLEALMRRFVELRVKPYYLHHGDLAPGTSHLRTTIAEGQTLMAALRGRLSGLAMPTYILDIPGAHGKVPIGPQYLSTHSGETFVVDPNGSEHRYSDCAPPV